MTGVIRWREHQGEREPAWALAWAWMHPFVRSRGKLKRAWPYFRRHFQEFDVEGPYSDAMLAFLRKHQPDVLEPGFRPKFNTRAAGAAATGGGVDGDEVPQG